uniref:COP9 signalosome complex subunit 9 n=1 Tax=Coptotermes formosanus TaxID=36987 RepID=R4UV65_COPFO|nr:hypothetical protein [Coptotermes formosanus]
MKPTVVADEMFPEGAGPYMDLEEAGGSSGLLMDLAANEKAVHADFFNALAFLTNMSEKGKSASPSAIQVKNRQKTTGIEDKLSVIIRREKRF